jgi:hypothetical protein
MLSPERNLKAKSSRRFGSLEKVEGKLNLQTPQAPHTPYEKKAVPKGRLCFFVEV